MSRLVPATRTDRTGRTQTRWVKPEQPGAATRAIPAPDEAILAALKAPGSAFVSLPSRPDGIMSLWESNSIAHTAYTLDDFDPRAVKEVERLMTECREPGQSAPPMVLQISVSSALKLMADEGDATDFHNLAVFGRLLYPGARDVASDFVNFLHEYTGSTTDYLIGATEAGRARAEAMISFTARAERIGDGRIVEFIEEDEESVRCISPADQRIAQHIWEHPESADAVLGVLSQEGGPLPLEVVLDRLSHPQAALREGVL